MRPYDLIIFDKDGTLLDTSPGIYATNRQTLTDMGLPIPPPERLAGIMGPPLEYCFRTVCQVPEERVSEAVRRYVKIYSESGIHNMTPYAGMIETLKALKAEGYKTGVATLKEHIFVGQILRENHMEDWIDAYFGSHHGEGGLSTTKSMLIRQCLQTLSCPPHRALMVGDSRYDGEGAAEAGVDFLPVTYGFSIRGEEDLTGVPHVGLADSPRGILEFLHRQER